MSFGPKKPYIGSDTKKRIDIASGRKSEISQRISLEKFDAQVEEIRELKSEKAALASHISKLREVIRSRELNNNNSNQSNNREIEKKKKLVSEERIEELKIKIKQVTSLLVSSQSENSKLMDKLSLLIEENLSLRKENDSLIWRNGSLKQENDKLEEAIEDLSQAHEETKNDILVLQSKYSTLAKALPSLENILGNELVDTIDRTRINTSKTPTTLPLPIQDSAVNQIIEENAKLKASQASLSADNASLQVLLGKLSAKMNAYFSMNAEFEKEKHELYDLRDLRDKEDKEKQELEKEDTNEIQVDDSNEIDDNNDEINDIDDRYSHPNDHQPSNFIPEYLAESRKRKLRKKTKILKQF